MAAQSPAFIASGNINPSVVVKADPAANMHVLQAAGATDKPVGISQDGTYYAPGVAGSDGYAAHTGQEITVYGEAETCLATVGATSVAAGDYLKSDANADVVSVTFTQPAAYTQNTGIWTVGQALEAANPGELVRMVVRIEFLPGVSA